MTRRHSAEMLLLAGMGLFAAVIALLWLTPARLLWLFVGLAGWAFATDILWPSQQRRIVELAPQLRGMALALSVSFVFGGVGLGSAVAGWIYPTLGYAGVLAGSLLFLLLAAVSLAISHAALRRTEEATDSTDRRNTPSRGAASS